MSLEPKTFTNTTLSDLVATVQPVLWAAFKEGQPIDNRLAFPMAFLADVGQVFVEGKRVQIKGTGSGPSLYGVVVSLNDFGALGDGAIIQINARDLAGYQGAVG